MSDSSILLKQAYNENNEAIYVKTSIDGVEELKNKLNSIDTSIINLEFYLNDIDSSLGNISNLDKEINSLKEEVISISNNIVDIENEIINFKSYVEDKLIELKGDISKINSEKYNIHIERNNDKHCIIIENFDDKLKDSNSYRMVLLKKSRHKKKGSYWTVPMFDEENNNNYYFYDKNKSLLEYNKAYWNITSKKDNLWNGKWNIADLPCISINKAKNDLSEKLFPYFADAVSKHTVKYATDQTYIFKNNNNKKLRFGFAIYKKVNEKWERVSNIVEINLYAYDNNKYLINII